MESQEVEGHADDGTLWVWSQLLWAEAAPRRTCGGRWRKGSSRWRRQPVPRAVTSCVCTDCPELWLEKPGPAHRQSLKNTITYCLQLYPGFLHCLFFCFCFVLFFDTLNLTVTTAKLGHFCVFMQIKLFSGVDGNYVGFCSSLLQPLLLEKFLR